MRVQEGMYNRILIFVQHIFRIRYFTKRKRHLNGEKVEQGIIFMLWSFFLINKSCNSNEENAKFFCCQNAYVEEINDRQNALRNQCGYILIEENDEKNF